MLSLLLIAVASYLLGSVSFSLIAGRLMGVDLHAQGSGSAGATNAFRVLGPGPGATVFALDVLKGLLATALIAKLSLTPLPAVLGAEAATWAQLLAMASVMVGHVYTFVGRIFYGKWRGGKGVATGAGALLGVAPVALLVAVVVFAGVAFATRYVSLGSILATTSIPITLLVQRALGVAVPWPVLGLAVLLPPFIAYTHRENIRRLRAGTESRIGKRAARSR
ncbi:MAG TPA: glycerol-3-phosphate acyltransferase [Rubricoccaceae bacterium]|nr:glycerol-3-phosphate acyltransferase [Rubricoccaceae bacterium]